MDSTPFLQPAVSNPLRLEGDSGRPAYGRGEEIVSNPLRLEGDVIDDAKGTIVKAFLIHYGWRETPASQLAQSRPASF